jgi:succinate-semialdehyde dehydrogenase/glutarate-semialdehyde dehydrogenase
MAMESINPYDGSLVQRFEVWPEDRIERALEHAASAAHTWGAAAVMERCGYLAHVAEVLRSRRDSLAALITQEMGKLIAEARSEIEKCAWVCEHYAERAAEWLSDEPAATEASSSYVAYQPLGTVFAIMPWNFPFWQVFRFAAPALAAGNTGLLKHASNVPRCALAIEEVFSEAGAPKGVFQSLLVSSAETHIRRLMEDPRVHAVTLTGSEAAGRRVAALAGSALKKAVLELGGSDAFVVLEDADLEQAARSAAAARFLNAGQSCIAAKRFIVVDEVGEEFVERFRVEAERLQTGDPSKESTTLAPLARSDLREDLHRQVTESIEQGAVPVTGCAPLTGPGYFYAASILDRVQPGMPAYAEEVFGPVAAVIRAADEADAVCIANDSRFGLGGSVWTRDARRGERVARQLQCGCAFVNAMVKSDPRLPFGGVKASGYGRELSHHGLREFVNIKTVWVG